MNVSFHHIGISVGNLDRSVAFFTAVFGLEPGMVFEIKPNDETAAALALPLHRQRVAFLLVGDVLMELIEFDPPRRQFDGRQDDIGYAYPCFAVDDIEAAYKRLTAMGITINQPPTESKGPDPVTGSKFCIIKDPDGKNVELVQMGPGMSLEKIREAAAARLTSLDRPLVLG